MKKKYLVSMYIDVSNMEPCNIPSYVESIQNAFTKSDFEEFLEADVMVVWFPVQTDSRIEVKEIV